MQAMSSVRWPRARALERADPLEIDRLDEVGVLILDDVQAADDAALAWCRRAPCVVVGCSDPSGLPSTAVDVALAGADVDRYLAPIEATVTGNPRAARTLVDVLRVVERLDVADGLVVESLAYSALLGSTEFAMWLAGQPVRTPRPHEDGPVRVERQGGELHLSLARPAARNAFSAPLRDALLEALRLAEMDDTIRRVVLDGDGPVFCSGGDLTEFGSSTDVARAHQIRVLRSIGAIIARLADRVTVTMRGTCVGAGVELSAFAGHVRAEPGTRVLLPEVSMGLIPGAGGTVSLTCRLGRQRTALLALLGEPVDVGDAMVAGLVDEIVPGTIAAWDPDRPDRAT